MFTIRMMSRLKEIFSNKIGSLQYYLATNRNYYKCKIVGEKANPQNDYDTIILYRIVGKRDSVFEIPIQTLLQDKSLIENFHPSEAIKIGAIAMGDSMFRETTDLGRQRFHEIKKKMLGE